MTNINKDFIKAMQERLDEKEKIYTGKKNYKNMSLERLSDRIGSTIGDFWRKFYCHKNTQVKKELIDLANFCWMLWEKILKEEENK